MRSLTLTPSRPVTRVQSAPVAPKKVTAAALTAPLDAMSAVKAMKLALEAGTSRHTPITASGNGLGWDVSENLMAKYVDPSLLDADLLTAGAGPSGKVFHVGGADAATMELKLAQIDGGVQLTGRVTPGLAWQLEEDLGIPAGFEKEPFLVAGHQPGRMPTTDDPSTTAWAYSAHEEGKYSVDYVPTFGAKQAWRHQLRVTAFGATSDERKKNLEAALAKLGAPGLLANADPVQSERLMRLSVLRQVAPKTAEAMGMALRGLRPSVIDEKLAANGVDAERMKHVRYGEVFPGHSAAIDPALGQSYAAMGVKALMVGVGSVETAAKILSSEGLMSTTERFRRGIATPGASLEDDEETGGAEFAFMRMVPERVLDTKGISIASSAFAGEVQLISTGERMEELLSRTDWHAYAEDSYGATVSDKQRSGHPGKPLGAEEFSFSARKVGQPLVDSLFEKGRFQADNEIVFKTGVRAKAFTHAVVRDEKTRAALLAAFAAAGVKELDGRPVADCIVLASQWDQVKSRL